MSNFIRRNEINMANELLKWSEFSRLQFAMSFGMIRYVSWYKLSPYEQQLQVIQKGYAVWLAVQLKS